MTVSASRSGGGRTAVAPAARRVRLHRLAPGPGQRPETETLDGAVRYERLTWTGDRIDSDFGIRSVVASWEASTPGDTWIEVSVRGGATSAGDPWIVLGRWAETDRAIRRTTVPGQNTDTYSVAVDEIAIAAGYEWQQVQARVTLARPAGSPAWPSVESITVLTSGGLDDVAGAESLPSGVAHAIDVPPHSQQLYRDQDRELDGGGQNWCSPTAVTMVLEHWGVRLPDPAVPYAARHTYDDEYGGTGNWTFNAAFAARFGVRAFVTRLRSLAEAELFTRAGIPLVLGVKFSADQLDGAGYDTNGHLLVLVGFDEHGDPVVNDPASHRERSDEAVRTIYRRDQFLAAWQHRGSGIVYVIHPAEQALPPVPDEVNW